MPTLHHAAADPLDGHGCRILTFARHLCESAGRLAAAGGVRRLIAPWPRARIERTLEALTDARAALDDLIEILEARCGRMAGRRTAPRSSRRRG